MRFVYTGPSWAASSYPVELGATNLAKEWKLPFFDCAMPASNVLQCIDKVARYPALPIVWFYHEPLGCLTEATGLTVQQFLTRSDWKDVREDCNQFCLQKIADLSRPVLLFGAHSDVENCNHSNIIVGDKSWQKFLASHAQMLDNNGTIHVKMADGGDFSFTQCWGAEIVHRAMHENPEISPTIELTNAIWDIFFFWKELEKHSLFYDVHPNLHGNELFASKIKPIVTTFLEDIK